ncbi:MAG: ABC transporter substrate-binding protein [Clostridia bacterium]|nr:ABC transporter substrate-binding protein [Clostridia bacterium]
MKKFLIAILCTLFLVPFGIVGCKDDDSNVIKVCEVTHSVFYAPLYIAINNGYFEEYDIEIELSNGGGADKCMNALVSKSADIALMGPEATIYVANQGKQDMPVVFGQLTQRDGSFIIGREQVSEFTWDVLSNKEILGGRQGGVPAMTLEYAIEKNNVENCTINYDVAFDNLTSAFIGGTGDFVTAFEPTASQIVANGKGYILASVGAETGEIPYTAFTANRSYINENKDNVMNFLRAIIKGYNFLVSASIDEIVNSLRPSFDGTSDELLKKSIEAYIEIDSWSRTPVMSKVAYDNLIKIMKNAGKLTEDVAFEKVVDNSIAQEVLKDFV